MGLCRFKVADDALFEGAFVFVDDLSASRTPRVNGKCTKTTAARNRDDQPIISTILLWKRMAELGESRERKYVFEGRDGRFNANRFSDAVCTAKGFLLCYDVYSRRRS